MPVARFSRVGHPGRLAGRSSRAPRRTPLACSVRYVAAGARVEGREERAMLHALSCQQLQEHSQAARRSSTQSFIAAVLQDTSDNCQRANACASCSTPVDALRAVGASQVCEALCARFAAGQIYARRSVSFSNLSRRITFVPQPLMSRSPGRGQRCVLEAAAARKRQAGVSLRSCASFCCYAATSDTSPLTWRIVFQPTVHDAIWALRCECCIQPMK